MWLLVHGPGMNGPNTTGLLGKGLSATITSGGVQSIHPRDVYVRTELLNHVSKEQGSRGEYMKKRGPGRRKFIDGGLFRALYGAGVWMGAGAGVGKKNAPPRAIDRGGAGN